MLQKFHVLRSDGTVDATMLFNMIGGSILPKGMIVLFENVKYLVVYQFCVCEMNKEGFVINHIKQL